MDKTEKYDLIIIGGGPAGYIGAVSAAKKGKKVAVCESSKLGGTCLNVGCIPTKFLLDKANLIEKIKANTINGIFKDAGLFSFKKIQQEKSMVVAKLNRGVGSLLRSHGIAVYQGFASVSSPHQVTVGGNTLTSDRILLATGSEVLIPDIPGKELSIDSTDALNLEKLPVSMVVIGGGVIGLELASAYNSFGTQVTVLEMLPSLLPGEDSELIGKMRKILARKGIEIITSAKVESIGKEGNSKHVIFSHDDETKEITAEQILMAVGRKAQLKGIDTNKLGIQTDIKGNIIVDEFFQTGAENLYAVGDVIGGWQLAHSAYTEAEAAITNMFIGKELVSLSTMPRCIYTIPPYAAVGETEAQLKDKGVIYSVGRFSYALNGMALAEGVTDGEIKVLVETGSNRILAVQIFGELAHELIATATMALSQKLTVEKWEQIITAHPSLSEVLHEAVLDANGASSHKPA